MTLDIINLKIYQQFISERILAKQVEGKKLFENYWVANFQNYWLKN